MKKIIAVLTLGCVLTAYGQRATTEGLSEKPKVKMILDLDTGIDDAMALAYALGNPHVELIGVTTVFGNVTRRESAENTLRLLKLLDHEGIPVYPGADRPLEAKEVYRPGKILKEIHGENGVGNVRLLQNSTKVQKESAADFMVGAARKYGKELYIVATGAETNLATVLKKDPKFGKKVGKIVVMGGALMVAGNVGPSAEANIANDPIAANAFFTSGTPFIMVGLDVTTRTVLTKKETQRWRGLRTTAGEKFADIVDYYIDWSLRNDPTAHGVALHDPLAVAVAVHPEFVKTITLPLKVDTSTSCQRGRTLAVKRKLNDPQAATVNVAIDVKVDEFLKNYMEVVEKVLSKK